MMKLYQFPFSPNSQKVVALAYELETPLTMRTVDVFKGESRTAEMLAKNPNGKVPILEHGDFVLWESNAILGYLAGVAGRTDLAPTGTVDHAAVGRWLAWEGAHFGPAVRKVAVERVVKKLGRLGPPDETLVKQGTEEFHVVARVLDACLGGREYLCGTLTIADFALTPAGALLDDCGLDLSPYRHAAAWLERMLSRPSVRRMLAEVRAAA